MPPRKTNTNPVHPARAWVDQSGTAVSGSIPIAMFKYELLDRQVNADKGGGTTNVLRYEQTAVHHVM